jgi:hypothetical protein
MNIYENSLDPDEVRDFVHLWTDRLDQGETITAIDNITFIDAAGTTQPSVATATQTSTRIWLTGGNPGTRAIFTIRVTTSKAKVLEEAFAVDIQSRDFQPAPETEVERLTREISEAKAQRALVAQGKAVIDAWKDGRRIRRLVPTLAELEDHIRQLEGELYQAQVDAGEAVRPRRTAISGYYC